MVWLACSRYSLIRTWCRSCWANIDCSCCCSLRKQQHSVRGCSLNEPFLVQSSFSFSWSWTSFRLLQWDWFLSRHLIEGHISRRHWGTYWLVHFLPFLHFPPHCSSWCPRHSLCSQWLASSEKTLLEFLPLSKPKICSSRDSWSGWISSLASESLWFQPFANGVQKPCLGMWLWSPLYQSTQP